MRIVYLFDRPLPATETDSEQALQTLCALARRGHEMILIVPANRTSIGAQALRDYYQVQGDFELVQLENRLSGWSTGRKWLHATRALDHAQALRPDLVYTRNFPSLLLATRQRYPFVYETYRPWFVQFPVLRPGFSYALRHRRCLGAMLHSHYARKFYAELGVEADKLAVVHNGYDPNRFASAPDKLTLRARLGLPRDATIATYAGHINATKGLDIVLKAASKLDDVHFVLVGSSGEGLVERLARGRPNVQIVPWQAFDRTVHYLLASDVLIQPPSRIPLGIVGNTVLPMKLFLYLAAGRPIVAPDSPDVHELLRHESNALLVPPGDSDATAAAIRRLLDQPALAARLAEAARATARDLTWDARAEKIERLLLERLSRNRTR